MIFVPPGEYRMVLCPLRPVFRTGSLGSGPSKPRLQAYFLPATLLAVLSLEACGGGSPPSTVTPPPHSALPPTPTTLRVLNRVRFSDTDRMTSAGLVARTAYALDGGTYYVADQPANGRTPLNRYMSPGATDHADGTSPPSGYAFEEVLGYPWVQSSLPGLDVL